MVAATPRSSVSPAGLASSLRLMVARLSRRMRQVGMSEGDDLTASLLSALTTIEARGPIPLGELAAIERVQPPSMTSIIAGLEKRDVVRRAVDANDRRVARVELTDSGKRLLVQSRNQRDAFLAQRISRLSEEDRNVLARALTILDQLQEDD